MIRKIAASRGKRGIGYVRKCLTAQQGGILPFLIPILAGLGGAGAAAGIAGATIPAIARNAARNATNSAIDTVEERAKKLVDKL